MATATLVIVGALLGCHEADHRVDPGARPAGASRVAPAEDPLAALLRADRAFAAAVAEGGLDAWVAAFDEGGAMLPPTGPVPVGREAVRETMASEFARPGFAFSWQPLGGGVSASGDLAYTFGDYETRDGEAVIARGRYLTVWRKDDDGVWRVLSDIGNRDLGDPP